MKNYNNQIFQTDRRLRPWKISYNENNKVDYIDNFLLKEESTGLILNAESLTNDLINEYNLYGSCDSEGGEDYIRVDFLSNQSVCRDFFHKEDLDFFINYFQKSNNRLKG